MTQDLIPNDGGDSQIAILHDNSRALEIIQEIGIAPEDVARVTVPSGSSGAFFSMIVDGEEQAVKTADIVIAHMSPVQRAFYHQSIDDGNGNDAPTCASDDGLTGFGVRDLAAIREAGDEWREQLEPTQASCADCQWSDWGSALNGSKGKACKQRQLATFFVGGNLIPQTLQIPSTSLKNFKKFLVQKVAMRGKRVHEIVTRVSLTKVKASTDYFVMEFDRVRDLSPEEIENLAGVAKAISDAAAVA
jgi:hypothetical protein